MWDDIYLFALIILTSVFGVWGIQQDEKKKSGGKTTTADNHEKVYYPSYKYFTKITSLSQYLTGFEPVKRGRNI